MSIRDLFYSKNKDLTKSDHVCGSEIEEMTSEKELMLLIRLEKVRKPSLKRNPQSQLIRLEKVRKPSPQIHSQTDCVHMTTVTSQRSGRPTKITPN